MNKSSFSQLILLIASINLKPQKLITPKLVINEKKIKFKKGFRQIPPIFVEIYWMHHRFINLAQ